MADEKVTIGIGAQKEPGFDSTFKDAEGKLKGLVGAASSSGSAISGILSGLLPGIGMAIGAMAMQLPGMMANVVKTGLSAAAHIETMTKKLELSGMSAREAAKRYDELDTVANKLGTTSDEALVPMANRMENIAKGSSRALASIAAFSAVTGAQMGQVAIAFAKIEAGSTSAWKMLERSFGPDIKNKLKEFDSTFDMSMKNSKANAEILARYLDENFGKNIEEMGNTLAGQSRQIKDGWEDLSAVAVGSLTPALKGINNQILGLQTNLNVMAKSYQTLWMMQDMWLKRDQATGEQSAAMIMGMIKAKQEGKDMWDVLAAGSEAYYSGIAKKKADAAADQKGFTDKEIAEMQKAGDEQEKQIQEVAKEKADAESKKLRSALDRIDLEKAANTMGADSELKAITRILNTYVLTEDQKMNLLKQQASLRTKIREDEEKETSDAAKKAADEAKKAAEDAKKANDEKAKNEQDFRDEIARLTMSQSDLEVYEFNKSLDAWRAKGATELQIAELIEAKKKSITKKTSDEQIKDADKIIAKYDDIKRKLDALKGEQGNKPTKTLEQIGLESSMLFAPGTSPGAAPGQAAGNAAMMAALSAPGSAQTTMQGMGGLAASGGKNETTIHIGAITVAGEAAKAFGAALDKIMGANRTQSVEDGS